MEIPELGSYMENGINIDPIPLSMEEFAVSGDKDGEVCFCQSYHTIFPDHTLCDINIDFLHISLM